jgi:hypothetical protein
MLENEGFRPVIMTEAHIKEVHHSLGGLIADIGLGRAGCEWLSGSVA